MVAYGDTVTTMVSVIGMIQKQNKHIVTYHGRLISFCYRNDTETKQT